jgi:hypothetical protein
MSTPRSPWSGRTLQQLEHDAAGYGNQDQTAVDEAAGELMAWWALLRRDEEEGAA